ncbi:zinc finger protein 469 [Amia ocellicauda]|uniref:zinc finger protein 469 n=1 Tax=Amia ocellicauda TaxID=2972642 RepID=UPI00346491B4
MTGDTQHVYAIKESETNSKQQDEETLFDQFSDKDSGDFKNSLPKNSNTNPQSKAVNGAEYCLKDKESYSQREAVIRPQQAGKIDFKSLQNRPKFSSDRTWPSSKGSPQSPSGKSRGRDKNKKAGKGERNPQQLYRLSMTNSRSNPTIGIAYPQQKVTPPKKLETNRGPIIGSYRFHVPSIPEREAELQQEDLNYSRCFQEASSNLTSTNYTSHASGATGAAAHQQQTSQQPPAVPRENSSTQSGHLHYPEFQGNGTSSWHSPEKTFNGANYGVSSQKQSLFTEGNKSNTSFGPMPFQYGFPSLQDSATDSFSNDQNSHSQDYIDISLANNQVTHSTFPFHSSGDGQEEKLSNGQFDSTQPDGRAYPQASHLTQYLQSSQGAQSSLPCFKGRADLSKDVDGPISSSHSVEQKQNSFPESQTVFTQEEISLHNSGTASVHKRSPPPKDSASNQRILTQGNSLTRNIAQGSTSQMHFQGKAYGSSPVNTIHTGTVPFDKSIPSTIKNHVRITQAWEGPNKTFPPPDQNAAPYSTPSEKQYQFQCQPAVEQRQHTLKNGRYAWQQIHLTSAMPNQNRIELSRQLSNQSFPITSSEWQDSNKPHKHAPLNSPSGFHGKRQSEGFTNTRQENIKQNCSTSAFPFENGVNSSTQACDSRNKKPFCGLNQPLTSASSRNNNHTPLQVPPVGLISSSPYESPLPSPIQNPASSSTCSTLSPVSTSPVNMSSEDSQLPMAGPPPPFYHQHCHLKEGKSLQSSDQLNSSLHHLHPDVSRNFSLPPERTKDDMFNFLHDTKFSKPNSDSGKGCMNSFGVDHPPPPPYSAHQLLANSLAAANLDQLDVLLTCKQCDQNFNNLSSFLEHKQYCGQHTMTQSDFKDTAKVEESRKFQMDLTKTAPSIPTFPLSRCPSDLHLSLLGLNKNGELLSDGDPKDDPLKLNLFNGMTALPVSLTSSDLEIDDAKLDSLITEALNGLGYQSDNAEIDSSFIDAFTDDDLSTAKITGSGQSTKMKDSALFESKSKHVASAEERSQLHLYDFDRDTLSTENKNLEIETEKRPKDLKEGEKDNTKEVSHKKTRGHSFFEKSSEHNDRLKLGRKPISDGITESGKEPGVLVSKKVSDGSGLKSYQESSSLTRPAPPDVSTRSTVTQRFGVKESKKRKSGGGTWSKELIHKIVQQKNKLHKLHVKGTKNLQFSLVMERLVPAPQNSKFGEYDYVSDSDEESEPLKIANRGRLAPGLGGRSKYSYGKEYKGRGRGEKEKPWKYNSKEGFESKIIEPLSPPPLKETSSRRVRRRSSRSSTSSDLSTPASLSSESVNSPKNNDRTDSDNERGLSEKRKGSVDINLSDSFEHETYERSPPEVPKEPSAAVPSQFSKSTKKYGSAKFLLFANKSQQSKCMHSSNTTTERVLGPTIKTYSINKSLPRYSSKGSVVNETSECCVSATDNSDRTEETSNVTNVNTAITTENTSFKETLTEFQTTESTRKSSCISETVLDANSDIADFNKNVTDDALATDKSGFEINNRRLHSTSVVLLPGEGPSIVPFERISESVFHDKESLNHFDCDVFHKPAPLAITSADDVCLCPADLHGGAVPKDTSKQGPITYPIEPDQSLMKSPLTFDTSSMFGDLAVPSFDNSLYVDVPMNKEGFHSFTSNNDKRELFEPPFPQYLGQKDWSLMDDVNPMLPDDIAQFQGLSEKALNKKFNSSHMPLALPEKLTDYNTNFISNISEDELEIKRIVTELESQLQTTKLTGATSLASEISKQLNSNKFSPLHLDHEAESAQNMSMHDTGKTAELAVTSVTTDPSLEEHYEDPDQSWSSAFQFGSLEGQQCLHTPVHAEPNSPEHFYNKEGTETLQSNVGKEAEQTENDEARATSAIKGPLTDKSEEMLENQMYAENLMKSLEVISDSIFNKGSLSGGLEETQVSQYLNKAHRGEESAAEHKQNEKEAVSQTAAVKREEAQNQKSEKHEALLFPFENTDCSPDTDAAQSPQSGGFKSSSARAESNGVTCKDVPVSENKTKLDESHTTVTVHDTDLEPTELQITEEKAKDNTAILTETSETDTREVEHTDISEDSSVNPLQQLELFVARTVKHNEEEMVMPSYPMILCGSQVAIACDQSEVKEEEIKANLSSVVLDNPDDRPKDPDIADASNSLDGKGPSPESKHAKEGNDAASLDLQKSDNDDEIQSTSFNQDVHRETPPRCTTPENSATDVAVCAAEVQSEPLSPCSTSIKTAPEPLYNSYQNLVHEEPRDIERDSLTLTEPDVLESKSCDTLVKNPQPEPETELFKCSEVSEPQGHCSIAELTLHLPHDEDHRTGKENSSVPKAISQSSLSLCKSPLPSTEHDNVFDHCDSQKMWNAFDRLSPISMENEQSPRKDSDDILRASNSSVTVSSGMPYSLVGLAHISMDIPEKKSLVLDSEMRIHPDPSLVNTLQPSDSFMTGEETFKETHSMDSLPNGPRFDSLYAFKQSPLNYKEIAGLSKTFDEYDNVQGALKECKDNQTVYNKSHEETYNHCDMSLSVPLMCKDSLSPISPMPDRDSTEPTENQNIQVNLCSPAGALQNIAKTTAKCSCPELLCTHYKESHVATITNAMLEFPSMPHDIHNIDICHSPLETIDYMELNIGLLKKADADKLEVKPTSPAEQETVSLKQGAFDGQESQAPLLLSPEGSSDIHTGQSETVKQREGKVEQNTTETKSIPDLNEVRSESTVAKKSSTQGTILCDICSACFRTVPGLKRHKAVKHGAKKEKNIPSMEKNWESTMICAKQRSQEAVMRENASVSTSSLPRSGDSHVQSYSLEREQNDSSMLVINHEGMDNCSRLQTETNLPPFLVNQEEINLVLAGAAVGGVSEKNKQKALESKGKQKVLTPMGKTKRADKAQKGKKVDNNRSYFEPTVGMAEHFSEDVLSMLKTDILQAITPNFPVKARGLDRTDTLLTQPEEQTRPNVSGSPKVKEDATFAFKQTDSVDKPELVAVCPEQTELCESAQMVGQNEPESPIEKGLELMEFAGDRSEGDRMCGLYELEKPHFDDVKNAHEQQVICSGSTDILEDSVKLKCSETSCPTDWGDPPTYPYKKPSASIAESQADLQALLDDESTFSQLFPRDEQMIRKKCTRVYGKRNKKTNLPPDLSLQQTPAFLAKSVDNKELSESHESPAFVSKLRDQCEYETISIDDAIMLDMCHKSTLKNDSLSAFDNIIHPAEADTGLQTEDPIDKGGVGVREFLCQEDETIHNTSAQWNHSKDLLTDIVAKSVLSLDTSTACKTEDTDTPCHQQLSDASDSQASVTDSHDNTSHFHNIDIQNLNTKFQLPDIKFFESGKDNVNADITDSDIAGSQSMKPSKRPLERKTRKRSEAGIKPKDKQYKCKACFTWFLTIGELNFHKLSHNPSPPPTCYMCVQRKFSSREQLRDHLKEKHAKNKAGIWTCGMCLKEISDVWMYNEHLREHATQFARKGQAQKSVLGLPGCFMQETAVKNFLSSIMQRRPSRSVKSDGSKTPAKEGKAAKENLEQDPKAKDASETAVKNKLNSGGGGKHTTQVTQTQSEDMPKVEASQKSVVMHPNCKDPSRDCHHCGKQFPKPFKLQRHLVVHSLQKIFLCHKCPIFYKELQELKTHLKDEHSVIEEPEVKHTTLYACELCADVMHVIKKSFICSTCNYTFSKKEQYDRHMEKHLAGGSKTFKFRGVMRPCKSPKDEEFELQTSFKKEYMPPNKKRKISSDSLTENSSDSGIASMASLQFNSHGEVHLSKQTQPVTSDFFTETVDNPHSSLEDVSVKSEDFAEDVSELVVVMEPSPFVTESESPCPSPAGPKTNTVDSSASPELPLAEEVSTVCDGTAVKSAETCDIQIDDDYCDQQSKQCDSVLAVNDRGARGDEFSSSDSQTQSESISQMREELQSLEASKEEMDSSVPTKTVSETPDQKHQSDASKNEDFRERSESQNTSKQDNLSQRTTDIKQDAADVRSDQTIEEKQASGDAQKNECEQTDSKAASSSEFQTCGQTSSRSSENAKHSTDYTKVVVDDVKLSTGSQGLAEPVTSYSKPSTLNVGKSEEKDLLCLKLQKKRKDFKISQSSKVSSSTRENFDSEMRKKKIRVQSPAKTESTGSYKKADITNDYPVLASVRDDMASNKIHLKPKTGGINMQPKRNSFESYPPKKADFRHLNGDFKGKKGIPGRPLHSSASKGSLPSVNSSMNKYRPVSGARSVESHNYRTAESQNHLLSQLFGQKLTSFKIPLRKDNSE